MNILENLSFVPEYRDRNNNPFYNKDTNNQFTLTGYVFHHSYKFTRNRYLLTLRASKLFINHCSLIVARLLFTFFISLPFSAQFSAIQEERPAYGERHPLLPHEATAETKDDERVGISWVAVAFGLANASIGVGILNHPYLYSRIGGIGLSILIQAVRLVFSMYPFLKALLLAGSASGSLSIDGSHHLLF